MHSTEGRKKHAPKRTPAQRILDRQEIAKLLRRGWTQQEIGDKLGIHRTMVQHDWKIVVRELVTAQTRDAEHLVAIKLAEIREVKKEAYEAWERSKKDGQKDVVTINEAGVKKTSKSKWGRLPEEAYLGIIVSCLEKEIQLTGLNPAKSFVFKGQVTSEVFSWDGLFTKMRAEQIAANGVSHAPSVDDTILGLTGPGPGAIEVGPVAEASASET
jgi:hypothetical protein